ncbi:MAG: PAS domain-containing protein [Pseudomonadota bacterium]
MLDNHVSELDRNASLLRQDASRRLYAYWNRLRGTRLAPERGDIEPGDLAQLLGDTFVLEVESPSRLTYRLAGTRLSIAMGRELRGENWLDGWRDKEREALETLITCVVHDVVGASIDIDHENHNGRCVRYEWALFPLALRNGPIGRIVGIATPIDRPYWLGAHPLARTSLADLRILWLNRLWETPDRRDMRLPYRGITPKGRYGHLALYEGGRID